MAAALSTLEEAQPDLTHNPVSEITLSILTLPANLIPSPTKETIS